MFKSGKFKLMAWSLSGEIDFLMDVTKALDTPNTLPNSLFDIRL